MFKNIIKFLSFTVIFLCFYTVSAKCTVVSWNLQNFGAHNKDWVMDLIAQTLKDFDIVAVQEVNAASSGSQAVAKLAELLNRTGNKWSYTISEITTSDNPQERERYAFFWKTSRVKLVGKPALASKLKDEICREPFMATFKQDNLVFTLAAIHAIPKRKQPETEIKYLKLIPELYPGNNFIFLGDFNCPQSHTVFNPLKKLGFAPALTGQKTTLKQQCKNGDCLASEYDNIFYPAKRIKLIASGVVSFYLNIQFDMVRKVSDHIPVFAEME